MRRHLLAEWLENPRIVNQHINTVSLLGNRLSSGNTPRLGRDVALDPGVRPELAPTNGTISPSDSSATALSISSLRPVMNTLAPLAA